MKHKKHNKIVKDYKTEKQKHLSSLANKILKKDEQSEKLKSKSINTDFLDLL